MTSDLPGGWAIHPPSILVYYVLPNWMLTPPMYWVPSKYTRIQLTKCNWWSCTTQPRQVRCNHGWRDNMEKFNCIAPMPLHQLWVGGGIRIVACGENPLQSSSFLPTWHPFLWSSHHSLYQLVLGMHWLAKLGFVEHMVIKEETSSLRTLQINKHCHRAYRFLSRTQLEPLIPFSFITYIRFCPLKTALK